MKSKSFLIVLVLKHIMKNFNGPMPYNYLTKNPIIYRGSEI